MLNYVHVQRVKTYDELTDAKLPDHVFAQIHPGDTVIVKPNWVMESHKYRPEDWEYVITHPAVITAVLRKVLGRLNGKGKVVIIDGPTTEASFKKLIAHYPVYTWQELSKEAGISLEVIDLREHEWETYNDIIIKRHKLVGDPKGGTEVDLLDSSSEFWGKKKSSRGYHGADYDQSETNLAHDGHHNRYRISRTVIEGDVFINLPKLKTHRKAGITCCLKNLVGINTYKNFLPHHSEGGPAEGGDQFPTNNVNSHIEGPLMAFLKKYVLRKPMLAHILSPLNSIGRKFFGDTRKVIRSGNWYGNDTIWRMILDLNKTLFFANADGTMRDGVTVNAKRYIGIVDAILAGEGHGPLAPDPVKMEYLFCGNNPVAIDAVSASFMGFSPLKIPTIARAFMVKQYPLCNFGFSDIQVFFSGAQYPIFDIPSEIIIPCEPQFGWKGHIEK
ncbi:MAG: DUF362 domain-containing protein [Candidatus Ozemobacteraceae bacterium]